MGAEVDPREGTVLLVPKNETSKNPTRLRLRIKWPEESVRDLIFVDRDGLAQKCSECWFHWFDAHLCQDTPCNSQGRTDGRVGTWQEENRRKDTL